MLPGVNVLLNGQCMLIPDLAVVTDPGVDTVAYKGDQCLLAVEIHSPSTRAYDRAMKRQLYAQAGVPFLIMIDPAMDAVSATAYELHGDEYRQMVRSRRGVLRFERPFPAEVDLTRSRR
jgi:Uma2 family endonuclease